MSALLVQCLGIGVLTVASKASAPMAAFLGRIPERQGVATRSYSSPQYCAYVSTGISCYVICPLLFYSFVHAGFWIERAALDRQSCAINDITPMTSCTCHYSVCIYIIRKISTDVHSIDFLYKLRSIYVHSKPVLDTELFEALFISRDATASPGRLKANACCEDSPLSLVGLGCSACLLQLPAAGESKGLSVCVGLARFVSSTIRESALVRWRFGTAAFLLWHVLGGARLWEAFFLLVEAGL